MSDLAFQVEAYLEAVAPRYSKASLRAYRGGLKRFLAYCDGVHLEKTGDLSETTLPAFSSWLCLHRPELADSTVELTLRSLKRFLSWACCAGLTLEDGESYSLVKAANTVPKPPTAAVMARLLELPDPNTVLGLRDGFCLELLYNLGLRRSECWALDLRSLDLAEATLRVVGKNGDERLLPVNPHLAQWAQDYLFKARPKLSRDSREQALFLGQRGGRLSDQSFRLIVRKYGQKLGLDLTAHQIRHACATHLVEAGMSLEHIRQLLGHRRLDSTQRYAQISPRQLEREYRRCAP